MPRKEKQLNIDSQNMKEVLDRFPQQIKEAYHLGDSIRVDKPVNKILLIGMGGSVIGGKLLKDYLDLPLPVETCHDYDIPAWVDDSTLVIATSYSGNTEETISSYRKARRKNAFIIVLTSGGRLLKMAQMAKQQVVLLPEHLQPRNAVAYTFFPILSILENAKLIPGQASMVKKVVDALKKPGFEKVAKGLVEKLYNKVPLIYASQQFSGVAYRWKTQFNENSKIMAFYHTFPELDHNAITGFEHVVGHFEVIMLKSNLDTPRMQKKMTITEKMIRERCDLTVLNMKGEHHLVQMFTAIYIGDLASYFLALRYKVDPSPVELVERLKKEMGSFI